MKKILLIVNIYELNCLIIILIVIQVLVLIIWMFKIILLFILFNHLLCVLLPNAISIGHMAMYLVNKCTIFTINYIDVFLILPQNPKLHQMFYNKQI